MFTSRLFKQLRHLIILAFFYGIDFRRAWLREYQCKYVVLPRYVTKTSLNKRFGKFLRHLVLNWIKPIKVCEYGGQIYLVLLTSTNKNITDIRTVRDMGGGGGGGLNLCNTQILFQLKNTNAIAIYLSIENLFLDVVCPVTHTKRCRQIAWIPRASQVIHLYMNVNT